MGKLKYHVRKLPNRRACPPWGVPAEAYRICFCADEVLDIPQFGIGYDPSVSPSPSFMDMIEDVLSHSIEQQQLPLQFQFSQFAQIDKRNNK